MGDATSYLKGAGVGALFGGPVGAVVGAAAVGVDKLLTPPAVNTPAPPPPLPTMGDALSSMSGLFEIRRRVAQRGGYGGMFLHGPDGGANFSSPMAKGVPYTQPPVPK